MTDLPPSWQSNQPPVAPPASPEPGNEAGQRMVRVRLPTSRPIVTYTILGVTIFVYLLQLATNAGLFLAPFLALGRIVFGAQDFQQLINQGGARELLILLGGKISPLIQAGQFWRLITPVFLHDDSIPSGLLHIGFNMYAVYSLGPAMESYYGHRRYLALYMLGGLGGNVLSFLMSPGWIPSIGASTAIFGLITAWGIFLYQNRSLFGARARSMLTNVIFIVVVNLSLGLSSRIDNWGHLGGLITGLIFGWFAGPRLEVAYNYPEYELIDQRSPAAVWLVGVGLSALLIGVVLGIVLLRPAQF